MKRVAAAICILFLCLSNGVLGEQALTVVDPGVSGVIIVPASLAAYPYPGKRLYVAAKWNGEIQTGIAIEPDAYTLEVAIPLAAIGIAPAKDRFIRFNCARNVYARQALGVGEAKEISAWYLSDDNLRPESRGWLVFNN